MCILYKLLSGVVLQRPDKVKYLLKCKLYTKTIEKCVFCTFTLSDCLISECIYSLGLKLGSTLPPHS